ncbi:MAG: class I SAM-dependent methyltransferase [Alphaproteobacteria bacterium]|nr:class I SAM-dependent methyltransferase [Alphaproteobacteria bacterium]
MSSIEASCPLSSADAARVDALWGDPTAWRADGLYWVDLPTVQRAINRRVTGDPGKTPLEWFFEQAGAEHGLPIGRALVLGCGGGWLERHLVVANYVREVVGVDVSARVIEHAAAAARDAGLANISYRVGDMNRLELDEAPFDIVFGVYAVHHCAALEALCDAIERLLVPDGWLYLDEYVGPSRFQWTDTQLHHANLLLDLLPDDLVRTRGGGPRRNYRRVSSDDIAAHDPSEAVRSAEIPAVVASRFSVLARRGYGGALLHLQLAQIAQNFLDAADGARAQCYLDRLIEAEDRLRQAGRLDDDFMVVVARRRA